MKKIGLIFRPLIDTDKIIELLLREHKEHCHFYQIQDTGIDENNESVKLFNIGKLVALGNIDDVEKPLTLDYILVFGGDGTILRSITNALHFHSAILGFNMGNLGFLTDCKINELSISLNMLLKSKYLIEKRMLLDIVVYRNNKKLIHTLALNDCVIYKGELSKLISLKLYANKRYVYETRCDGMITSTPTGSTAYSMSSGGPIISPNMEAFIVNPLNPHILSIRPMIFHASDTLHFKLEEPHSSTVLQIDGINVCQLLPKDKVIIKSSSKKINFIKLSHRTYYQILRKKLNMGRQ